MYVARVPTGRDQSDGICLQITSTYNFVVLIGDCYQFNENLNVSYLDRLSPKDPACLAQHSDVRMILFFKHALVFENVRF
jgi:hypothetical protein